MFIVEKWVYWFWYGMDVWIVLVFECGFVVFLFVDLGGVDVVRAVNKTNVDFAVSVKINYLLEL